jgi:hypothetical protein
MTAECPTCQGRGVLPDPKVCALDGCGKEFRWQDDSRGRGRPRTDAIYCSAACRHVAAQRAYRFRSIA